MNSKRQGQVSPQENLSEVVQLAIERVLAGESIDVEAMASGNPALCRELQAMLPAIEAMAKLDETALLQSSASGLSSNNGDESVSGTLGDFRILRVIGRGGMGTVYEARQLSLERPVALKVLPFASMLDERQLRRFKQEARAAAMLQHPHIVRVFAIGCDRGVHHYAMELIDGQSLEEVVKNLNNDRMRPGEKPMSDVTSHRADAGDTQPCAALSTSYGENKKAFYQSVASLGIDVARALAYAHREGVVHRDIKPSNLLLDRQGKVWITDFGLAQIQTGENITQTGDILGTLRYMSPEQLSGEKAIDHRTDVYSLALTLYELAALQPAYSDTKKTELVRRILESDPPRLRSVAPDVPRDLETVLAKAVAREPRDRYQTAEEFVADLERFVQHHPINARPSGTLESFRRWVSRNPTIASLSAAVMLLLTVVSVVSLASASQRSAAAKVLEQRLYVSDMVRVQELIRHGENQKASGILARYDRAEARGFEWYYLRTLVQAIKPVATLGHRVMAYTAAYSPNGKYLATSTWEGEICVWDTDSWARHQVLNQSREANYMRRCLSLTFTPDGHELIGACLDGVVRTWQIGTWAETALEYPDELPPCAARVAVSGDGKYFAVAYTEFPFSSNPAEESRIRVAIWRSSDRRIIQVLDAGSGRHIDLAFSRRTGQLAAACPDGILRVWDSQQWQLVRSIPYTVDTVSAIAFSPDGRYLATASGVEHPSFVRGDITIWDAVRWQPLQAIQHHDDRVRCLEFSPDGKTLAVGSQDHDASIWDVNSGTCLRSWDAHSGMINDISYSPDGQRLTTASFDNLVKSWDVTQILKPDDPLTVLKDHKAFVHSVCFSDEGRSLISADTAGRVIKRDFESGQIHYELTVPDPVMWQIQVTCSPDNRLLAVAIGEAKAGQIRVFDQVTGEVRKAIPLPEAFTHGLAFHPDSSLIAAASYDSLFVCDVDSGDQLAQIVGPSHTKSVAFSPGGQELAAATAEGYTYFFETDTFRQTRKLRTEETWGTMGIAYSPDGTVFATGGGDLRIKIWDARHHGDEPIYVFPEATTDWIVTVSFSLDGKRILSTGHNGSVRVWHPELGESVLNLQADRNWIMNGTFSPNGRALVIGANGIRVWEAADTFDPLVVVRPPNRPCFEAFELDQADSGRE